MYLINGGLIACTFVNKLSLRSVSAGERAGDRECVILSTVHQAKGLEWDTVFIIGLNDGRFPSVRSLKTAIEEEERRLFCVAVTGAKDKLYLCHPAAADDWQGFGFLRPSRFIGNCLRIHMRNSLLPMTRRDTND